MVQPSDTDDEIGEAELDDEVLAAEDLATRVEAAEQRLQFWLCSKYWNAEEASYLLTGLEPNNSDVVEKPERYQLLYFLPELCQCREVNESDVTIHNDGTYIVISYEVEARIRRVLELTKRFIHLEGEPRVRPPREWLKLAPENGHRVRWLEFASNRPGLKRYLPEGGEDRDGAIMEQRRIIESLTEEVERLRAENKDLSLLEGKARTSVLKIVGGMARAGWKLNLQKPETDKFKELLDDLKGAGAKTSNNTLRKHLIAAAEYVELIETKAN